MNSRNYFQLSAIAIVAIFISAFFITACHDDNDNSTILQKETLTEQDFFNNPDLRANPEAGLVAAFLEPSSASENDNLTGELGYDVIKYRYDRALNHRFCFIHSDDGSKHSIRLQDTEGSVILSTEAEGDCVSARVEEGHYELVLTHGEHIDAIDNIFLITVPDSQEFGMRESINQNSFAELFESIRNLFTKEAIAQTTDDNVVTLVSTNSCVGCDLSGVDLTGNDFTSANLTGANLSGSNLSGVSLSEAVLLTANLSGADLSDTNGTTDLSGADLTAANLIMADLTGADFSGAELVNANLLGADITDAVFDNADLVFAIWTNGVLCSAGSIGSCFNPLVGGPRVCESVRQDTTDDGTKVYKCLLPTVDTQTCTTREGERLPQEMCEDKDPSELVTSADLEDIIDQVNIKFSGNIDGDTPLALMAWGGEGGDGSIGFFGAGGDGGDSGFASMVTTLSDFEDKYGQSLFYFYLGEAGVTTNNYGDGGSSTLVMLVETNPRSLSNIILIGGGGGGGEEGGTFDHGVAGGFGGVAASSEKGLRVIGQGRSTTNKTIIGGANGNGGRGKNGGQDGIGGRGGSAFFGANSKWVNGDPDVGSAGRGGNADESFSSNDGAGGGGGHGGGGAGDESPGAGGGSWIDRSTITCSSAPMVDDNPDNNDDAPSNPGTANDDNGKNGAVEVWIFPDGC